jgi:hypothetical protein
MIEVSEQDIAISVSVVADAAVINLAVIDTRMVYQ